MKLLTAIVCLCALALPARAADIVLRQQGYLLGASDAPLDAPALPIVFRLFAAETPDAQAAIWASASCPVAVSQGYYSVSLGAECDGTTSLDTSMLPPDATRWLEIAVNGVTMSPRLRLEPDFGATRAAYALDADKLDGIDSTGFIRNSGTLQAGAQLSVASGTFATALTANGTVGGTGFNGWDRDGSDDLTTATNFGGDVSGNASSIAVADDSHAHGDATVSNSITIDNGRLYAPTGTGRVGVGTTSPTAPLDVAGTEALRVPRGTSGDRPTPAAGLVRFNTTTNALEYSTGTAWVTIGTGGVTGASAIGGNVVDAGGYRIHTFTTNNTLSVTGTLAVEVLVVAGGGGGGFQVGGGGGGGGVISSSNYVATGNVPVVVGNGGAGGNTNDLPAFNGGNSSFGSLLAYGGGAGANHSRTAGGYNGAGQPGGSGGGGAGDSSSVSGPGGAGTSGQGNNGGSGRAGNWAGGGGGGAGGVGQSSPSADVGGTGGIGFQSSISGTATYYGGGGGGCNNSNSTLVPGGLGGGGSGTGNGNNNPLQRNGQANTGGGGGGVRDTSGSGGNGGSGIVIVRYPI